MENQNQNINSIRTIRIAGLFLAMVWFYHGLIPKIIFSDTGELRTLQLSGLFNGNEKIVLTIIGIFEMIFALLILCIRKKFVHYLNIFALTILGLGVAFNDPASYTMPFNPFSLNISMIGISVLALMNFESSITVKSIVE